MHCSTTETKTSSVAHQHHSSSKNKSTGVSFEATEHTGLPAQFKSEVAQMTIHIGNEPDVPNNYRVRTTRVGSTPAHYGGGPMNIHAGVRNSNAAAAAAPGALPAPPAANFGSDHAGNAFVDRNWATDNEPELDHIVPVAQNGSNSYSNARYLTKRENNNGVAARPAAANIVTTAHHRIRIQDVGGYNNVVNAGTQLNAADQARIGAFGGIAAVIAANSPANAGGVTITEF